MSVEDAEVELEEVEEIGTIDEGLQEVTISDGVYLSGPIRCVDDNGHDWRDEIIEEYDSVQFHNPLDRYDPDSVEILNDPIDFDEESELEQILPSEYVSDDKISICKSDCVFVGLPEEIARGTMMECMYAALQDIPIFVWEMDGQQESGWIYHHATFVDGDRERVMEEILDHV